MKLVTVFTTFSPAEAQIVRSRLEAAEIPASVIHELAALSLEGYSMAAGGIQVQVAESDFEEARALIDAPPSDPVETPA